MQRVPTESGPVELSGPGPVPALLSGINMPTAYHARANPGTPTKTTGKQNITPNPGAFFIISPRCTVVDINERKAGHKWPVLQHPRLGIFEEPRPRGEVRSEREATLYERVREDEVPGGLSPAPRDVKMPRGVYGMVPR